MQNFASNPNPGRCWINPAPAGRMAVLMLASTSSSLLFLCFAAAIAIPSPAQQPSAPEIRPEIEHERLPAISQGRTGTCWAFATTSFLESELQRIHGQPIDLSELHTVYWTYVEKANRFVRLHGKTQFGQGGLSHDLLWVVQRRGLVPQAAYSGLLPGQTRHDHSQLESLVGAIITEVAESNNPGDRWQDAVCGVLDAYLGTPPAAFEVEGRSVTPTEYATELALPIGEYRQLMSFSADPYWRETELLVPDNWLRHQDYWNLPIEELLDNLDHALRSGYTVAVDIDVSERTIRGRPAVWTLPKSLEQQGAITAELRQQMFDSRQTTDDHLMHIVGLGRDDNGKTFYLTKDSSGPRGKYVGHVYISRNYLAAKLLSFMVHQNGLLATTRERFD